MVWLSQPRLSGSSTKNVSYNQVLVRDGSISWSGRLFSVSHSAIFDKLVIHVSFTLARKIGTFIDFRGVDCIYGQYRDLSIVLTGLLRLSGRVYQAIVTARTTTSNGIQSKP